MFKRIKAKIVAVIASAHGWVMARIADVKSKIKAIF